jgi:hypothetical protein
MTRRGGGLLARRTASLNGFRDSIAQRFAQPIAADLQPSAATLPRQQQQCTSTSNIVSHRIAVRLRRCPHVVVGRIGATPAHRAAKSRRGMDGAHALNLPALPGAGRASGAAAGHHQASCRAPTLPHSSIARRPPRAPAAGPTHACTPPPPQPTRCRASTRWPRCSPATRPSWQQCRRRTCCRLPAPQSASSRWGPARAGTLRRPPAPAWPQRHRPPAPRPPLPASGAAPPCSSPGPPGSPGPR